MSNVTFSACCISSGMTFSIPLADLPYSGISVGEVYKVVIGNLGPELPPITEFDACAMVVSGTSTTVYSAAGYSIMLTQYSSCTECQTFGIECCVSGTVDSLLVSYTDCCGIFVSGGTPGDIVCFDPNYPFRGIAGYGVPCTTPCASPTPTMTPSVTSTPLPCTCKQYQLFNMSLTDTANITYYDCYFFEQNDYIPPNTTFEICCCEGTLIIPSYVNVVLIGDCSEFNPSPTPTNSQTPTVTPSLTTTTTVPCTDEYCLNTGLSLFTSYDGTYYSAGTYNTFLYFTGGTEPGYLYFTGSFWCVSNSLGGDCLLAGPIPFTSNCPDLDQTMFYSGTCSTTTTTTNPCSTFDFDAYFDCDYSTTTTTTISCDDTDLEFYVSAYTTTTTTICSGTSVSASFTRYTTTTTTPAPITTTTTTLTVFFNSVVTFTVFEEEVTCPNLTYQFTDCNSGQNYYISEIPKVGGIPISPGEVYQLYINTYLVCATYIGTSSQSPNSILNSIVFINPDCTTCLTSL